MEAQQPTPLFVYPYSLLSTQILIGLSWERFGSALGVEWDQRVETSSWDFSRIFYLYSFRNYVSSVMELWPQKPWILSSWEPGWDSWWLQGSLDTRQIPGSQEKDLLITGCSSKATGWRLGASSPVMCVHYSWLVICSQGVKLPSDISEEVHDLLEASEEI